MNSAPYPLSTLEPLFIAGELALHAAEIGYRRAKARLRRPGRCGAARHPGTDTPLWNLLATQVKRAVKPYGRKAALARYLGLPRQRVTDFLSSRRRLPDAEITLRLLHWLEMVKRGRDLSA